ncbi:MAG TPA: BCD family MFS transporter [Gemmatimonadales bacterium]|nr:BCD family MFS transporter [Gemmatimonadales bacterium]
MTGAARGLSWWGVVRIGLVQASLGAIVVLMTSTLNRVMVVELALPAAIPGVLVSLHFAVQFLTRPWMGHHSDRFGRRTWTILAGMVVLAAGALGASLAIRLAAADRSAGLLASIGAFTLIGVGVSAAGTPLLTLLADRVAPERRGRAAAVVWLMMIAGFVVTTVIVGRLLEPFSFTRLVQVTGQVGGVACLVAAAALFRLEGRTPGPVAVPVRAPFGEAWRVAWRDAAVRRFAWFVFVAMLGYSGQDLILEPFAGLVFGLTPAESTRISGVHQAGMLLGMLGAGALAVRLGGLSRWASWGCAASAVAFILLAATPGAGSLALLKGTLLALGIANGAFAVGAIGSMMVRARGAHAGLLMGVFGAAQALAYAIGGLCGALGSDLLRASLGSASAGYGAVFLVEAAMFLVAAMLVRAPRRAADRAALTSSEDGEQFLAALS